jgi:hypothetical protein
LNPGLQRNNCHSDHSTAIPSVSGHRLKHPRKYVGFLLGLLFDLEDGLNTLSRNMDKFIPDYTASHPKTEYSKLDMPYIILQ